MKPNIVVRLMKSELHNFKNVNFGKVEYLNYSSLEKDARLSTPDILGIYGQNGSGKTALVEALDIIKRVISGNPIQYSFFSGLLSENGSKIISTFYIKHDECQYRVEYEVNLKAYTRDDPSKCGIALINEKISYQTRGKGWKGKMSLSYNNPFYDNDNLLASDASKVETSTASLIKAIPFLGDMNTLAAVCAASYTSVFFNDKVIKTLEKLKDSENTDVAALLDIIYSLKRYASVDMSVIRVNQLGTINMNKTLPINIYHETNNSVIQAYLPIFTDGQGELPEPIFNLFQQTIVAINIAIKAIVPDLQIEVEQKSILEKPDGNKYIQVEVYSRRGDKRFLIRYESEGIKRIISILNFLISVYNDPTICLVVDELDSGIFEYLLGEILSVMHQQMKGQLIFTSHNLRALETLDNANIICSTTNPDNRYIRLTGVNRNNNRRDFYIRALNIGGQKEELYDDDDLQSMGYAFRKAGHKITEEVTLPFTNDIKDKLQKADNSKKDGGKC